MIVARLADLDQEALFGPGAARSQEMQALADWLAARDAGLPDPTTLPPTFGRALADAMTLRLRAQYDARTLSFTTAPALDGTPLGIKIVAPPDAPVGTILYLHGGGWCFGSLETHETGMRDLAADTGRTVVGVDYRLAPEHPYPTPLDDCVAAWRWLRERIGRDPRFPGPVAAAGDSAGGNLVLALALREQAEGRPVPDALVLLYGAFGDDFETRSYRRFAEGYGLTRGRMMRFLRWYAGEGPHDELVAPLRARDAALARLPPMFLNAASLDPLLSDTLAMVARLEGLGHRHRFALHRGLHHGFHQMSARLSQARDATRLVGDWLADVSR